MTEKTIMFRNIDFSDNMADEEKEAVILIHRLAKRFGFNDATSTVIAHLMVTQDPLSIDDLSAITRLSRTSVSTALSLLESRFMVVKEKRGRVGYYTPNIDFAKVITEQPLKVLQEEIQPLITLVEKSANKSKDKKQHDQKLKLLEQLKGSALTLERIIKCMSM
ncbi:MAG: BlaI/MecI/CopY family transcriptional regulator [Thermoplasmataceae archaeon]